MKCLLASIFGWFWKVLRRNLGGKIYQKSIRIGPEGHRKSDGQKECVLEAAGGAPAPQAGAATFVHPSPPPPPLREMGENFEKSDLLARKCQLFWNFYFSIFGPKIKSENSILHEFLIQGGLGARSTPQQGIR